MTYFITEKYRLLQSKILTSTGWERTLPSAFHSLTYNDLRKFSPKASKYYKSQTPMPIFGNLNKYFIPENYRSTGHVRNPKIHKKPSFF